MLIYNWVEDIYQECSLNIKKHGNSKYLCKITKLKLKNKNKNTLINDLSQKQ